MRKNYKQVFPRMGKLSTFCAPYMTSLAGLPFARKIGNELLVADQRFSLKHFRSEYEYEYEFFNVYPCA